MRRIKRRRRRRRRIKTQSYYNSLVSLKTFNPYSFVAWELKTNINLKLFIMKLIAKDAFYKILEDEKLDLVYSVTETTKTSIKGVWKYRNGNLFAKVETPNLHNGQSFIYINR